MPSASQTAVAKKRRRVQRTAEDMSAVCLHAVGAAADADGTVAFGVRCRPAGCLSAVHLAAI